jgi:hypothetical protein
VFIICEFLLIIREKGICFAIGNFLYIASKIDEQMPLPEFFFSLGEEQRSISWFQLPAEGMLKDFLYGIATT